MSLFRSSIVYPSPAPPLAPRVDSGRRIDLVIYAGYEVRAQFRSPYPLDELNGANPTSGDKASQAGAGDRRGPGREAGGRFTRKPPTVQKEGTTGLDTASAARTAVKEEEEDVLSELGLGPAPTTAPSPELADPIIPEPNGASQPDAFVVEETDVESPVESHPQPDSASAPPSLSTLSTNPPDPQMHPHSVFALPRDDRELDQPLPFQLPATSTSASLASSDEPVASTSTAIVLGPSHQPSSQTDSSQHPLDLALANQKPPERGRAGRFLPKPPGETVKAKQAAERAARLATEAAGETVPRVTQRQQREMARRAREEREKLLAREKINEPKEEVKLFACERCFKYMALPAAYLAHQRECSVTRPPGRRVYQRGATSIWEVDGAEAKLYCQNLCLFAKLFIEHKYMFFDVEGFNFYLLTEATSKQEWVLGYFSKEKISYDDYNLACIVVFPPFRQKGWATLLIEFSYELSRCFSSTPGTPERPLSELGQKGYLAHWTAVLVRYFRAVFALRSEPPSIESFMPSCNIALVSSRKSTTPGAGDDDAERERRKRQRRSKGWDGELPAGIATLAASPAKAFTLRSTTSNAPRQGRVDPVDGSFAFTTTLEELADAVNLRSEDVAFALVESGLAQWRRGTLAGEGSVKIEEAESTGDVELELVITPELVEEVAVTCRVKPMPMLDVAYVCGL
ncbi:histone acetyltransferase [Rhodotorula toruloides]|uniref:Histone acetyltransferase n=1 Tax=Rhodotorula toruloides TaxID=5286 RepID=A0A511KMI7_RHOTO|nr:histone acetyltransferase [Rhodotorula toruloides]